MLLVPIISVETQTGHSRQDTHSHAGAWEQGAIPDSHDLRGNPYQTRKQSKPSKDYDLNLDACTNCTYNAIMIYEWDPNKANNNLKKHGVDFANAVISLEDKMH